VNEIELSAFNEGKHPDGNPRQEYVCLVSSMKPFRNHISLFSRFFLSAFIIAFFIDGADVLDIFSGSAIVVHSVEDLVLEQAQQDLSQHIRKDGSSTQKSAFANHSKHKKSSAKSPRIILDQDCASLAAADIDCGPHTLPYAPEPPTPLTSIYTSTPLFLKHCSLLI
jgi:hypothetical protein